MCVYVCGRACRVAERAQQRAPLVTYHRDASLVWATSTTTARDPTDHARPARFVTQGRIEQAGRQESKREEPRLDDTYENSRLWKQAMMLIAAREKPMGTSVCARCQVDRWLLVLMHWLLLCHRHRQACDTGACMPCSCMSSGAQVAYLASERVKKPSGMRSIVVLPALLLNTACAIQ